MTRDADKMLNLLREDADICEMVAELRNNYLDLDAVSRKEGYDILGEVVACPKHVILHVAKYIEILQESKEEETE